jgi:hypothetical protein
MAGMPDPYQTDVDRQGIPWDFHCRCTHVAASHWYATGHGGLVSGRCHECPMKFETDVCKAFVADNLIHLEMKSL